MQSQEPNYLPTMGKTSLRLDRNSHANHKFEKLTQFYKSIKNPASGKAITKEKLQWRRSRRKNLNAYDLSSLAECLPDLEEKTYDLSSLAECLPDIKVPLKSKSKRGEVKLNTKTRNDLVLKECSQLKAVITHPVFQSDPLDAIYKHLQNTQFAGTIVNIRPAWRRQARRKTIGKKSKALPVRIFNGSASFH